MYVSLNGKLVDSKTLQVSPLNEAFLYGYGLFETIKIFEGKMYFLKEHIERLKNGCITLNLSLIYDYKTLEEYCYELIRKNQLISGGIRISYSKKNNEYFLLITTRKNNYTEDSYKRGFKLCFADIKRNPYSPLVYLKSNNYLESLLARQKALEMNYNEAVFININEKICEGTISNLFFIKNRAVYTPDTKCGLLSGILREKVIDIINSIDLELCIGEFEKENLFKADEIFLTNSLMDIMPVSKLEDKKFDIKNNRFTKIIQKEVNKLYGK